MTDYFESAFQATLKSEGTYSNVNADRGGETYMGISRVWHPEWEGWKTVDRLRGEPDFPSCLDGEDAVQHQVKQFYKREFWDPLRLGEIHSPAITAALFDMAVNMGSGTAAKILQRAANLLNKQGKVFPDLAVDGKIGPGTLSAMRTIIKAGMEKELCVWMMVLQGYRRIEIIERDPSQEAFARGWANRVMSAWG